MAAHCTEEVYPRTDDEILTLSAHDVSEVVSTLKRGKVADHNEIKPEMTKHSGMTGLLGVMWNQSDGTRKRFGQISAKVSQSLIKRNGTEKNVVAIEASPCLAFLMNFILLHE